MKKLAIGWSIGNFSGKGQTDRVVTRPIPGSSDPVSQRNKAIVAPFLPKLKESAALAFFGL